MEDTTNRFYITRYRHSLKAKFIPSCVQDHPSTGQPRNWFKANWFGKALHGDNDVDSIVLQPIYPNGGQALAQNVTTLAYFQSTAWIAD